MIKTADKKNMSLTESKNTEKIFLEKIERDQLKDFEKKELPIIGKPGESCKYNLFFGFFFDGTCNNYLYCEPKTPNQPASSKRGQNPGSHSNVARLYDIYPGRSVPGVLPKDTDWANQPQLYQHFFKTYIPGVGTEFQQVNDSVEGFIDGTLGAATANHGNERIGWGLIQAINCVHRFFKKDQLLINSSEAQDLIKQITLSKGGLKYIQENTSALRAAFLSSATNTERHTCVVLNGLLTRLKAAIQHHIPATEGQLPQQLDPGIVQTIHMSVFGFSRGAAKARAFSNWLLALGTLDARLNSKESIHPHTLGGIPFKIDFVGIFDTVASVGPANTFGDAFLSEYLDGHSAWADAEVSLKVDPLIRCVHLVSAHEIRRSFPLDSICVNKAISSKHDEIVYPGVHSDVGGGYAPREQGKGTTTDGRDMMSRIPLLEMYRLARLSGVPLKLELATAKAQERFAITPQVLEDFNAYIDTCSVGRTPSNARAAELAPFHSGDMLSAIFREQRQKYIHWRLLRRQNQTRPLEQTASFLRSTQFEQNDLRTANIEFEREIKKFQSWLSKKGKDFQPATQEGGFQNEYKNEWEEIARWWRIHTVVPLACLHFFDEYVHDSRAWFKLYGADNEADQIKDLEILLRLAKREEQFAGTPYSAETQLSSDQRQAAYEYERSKKIPAMAQNGREPFFLAKAGHLRYRKIYAGHDQFLLSQSPTNTHPSGETVYASTHPASKAANVG